MVHFAMFFFFLLLWPHSSPSTFDAHAQIFRASVPISYKMPYYHFIFLFISFCFVVIFTRRVFEERNELNPLKFHCLQIESTIQYKRCHLNEISSPMRGMSKKRRDGERERDVERETETIKVEHTHVLYRPATIFIWFNLVFHIHSRVDVLCVLKIEIFVYFFCFDWVSLSVAVVVVIVCLFVWVVSVAIRKIWFALYCCTTDNTRRNIFIGSQTIRKWWRYTQILQSNLQTSIICSASHYKVKFYSFAIHVVVDSIIYSI